MRRQRRRYHKGTEADDGHCGARGGEGADDAPDDHRRGNDDCCRRDDE
jgi:hypothetical protein